MSMPVVPTRTLQLAPVVMTMTSSRQPSVPRTTRPQFMAPCSVGSGRLERLGRCIHCVGATLNKELRLTKEWEESGNEYIP